jgi:hypothetical protein
VALSHTAWGHDTVQVSHAPDGIATIVEFQGNRISTLFTFGVIDTAERLEQGDLLCRQSRNRHIIRAVVPKKYSHLRVNSPKKEVAGRWQMGFSTGAACRPLEGLVTGEGSDVLAYTGSETTVTLELLKKKGDTKLLLFGTKGSKPKQLKYIPTGQFRGPIKLPGPGLLQVDTLGPWSLTVH